MNVGKSKPQVAGSSSVGASQELLDAISKKQNIISSSDDIPEGENHKYFTEERAKELEDALKAFSSFIAEQLSKKVELPISTDDVVEGKNKYYSEKEWDKVVQYVEDQFKVVKVEIDKLKKPVEAAPVYSDEKAVAACKPYFATLDDLAFAKEIANKPQIVQVTHECKAEELTKGLATEEQVCAHLGEQYEEISELKEQLKVAFEKIVDLDKRVLELSVIGGTKGEIKFVSDVFSSGEDLYITMNTATVDHGRVKSIKKEVEPKKALKVNG